MSKTKDGSQEEPKIKKTLDDAVEEVKEEESKKKAESPQSPEKPKEESKDDDDEDIAIRKGVSWILADGSLVEMLYDTKKHQSKLAVCKDGKISLVDSIDVDDYTKIAPMSPNQSILENGFVLFPSAVGDYKSNEELYHEVRAFIDRYVKLNDKFLSVVAVYVMLSWVYDRFQNIPYLRAVGLFGTGKTRLLSVAGAVCYKTVRAGGSISISALFRTLDLFKPTLAFDEAELSEKESVEMRQVLRQGYSVGAPATRMEKAKNGNYYVQTFHVFGPKLIASQSDFRDPALESRCLTEYMYPMAEGESRPTELSKQFEEEALVLRNKLLMFRFKTHGLVTSDEEALNSIRLPRLKQTGLAVVSVAKMLGLQPLQDVVEFLVDYEKIFENQMTDTVEHDVLLCILDLLKQKHIKGSGKIRIGLDLAERFDQKKYEEYSDRKQNDSNSPHSVMKYPTYKVSPKKIGGYVRKVGIRVERDSDGFYIPIVSEYQKIRMLALRYRLDRLYVLPKSNCNGVRGISEPETENSKEEDSVESNEQIEKGTGEAKKADEDDEEWDDPFETPSSTPVS